MISFFVAEIFKFPYYANLVTDDIIGCASTVVWHKIKNISANNVAMLLKLGRDVAPYEICQMIHILMLLWQHAWFQSPASSKWNIAICDLTRQNTWPYLRPTPVLPSFCSVQLPMVTFDFKSFKFYTTLLLSSTLLILSSTFIYDWMQWRKWKKIPS